MTDHNDRDDLSDDEFLDPAIQAAFGSKQTRDIPGSRSVVEIAGGAFDAPRVHLRDVIDEVDSSARVRAANAESNGYPGRIDRYQVVGEIARGGVGVILRARDADLGRELAIKVLRNEHRGNGYLLRRFLEEAQIGGQLQHPGVVPVYEIGLYEMDRPYLAMKYVKGRTLGELLESREDEREEPQRFLGVFEQVCQTLAYAHARGVIHRDLKPSNVMVGPFGEVQVMDWGLAKVLEKGGVADDKRSTKLVAPQSLVVSARSGNTGSDSVAGSVIGTPAYMAPEQASGDIHSLDEHTDVFGLGAILCEILTGLPPYVGKTSDEVLEKARSADLVDAYDRLENCRTDRTLADLAKVCLSADKRDRPRNAIVVSKRIRSYLASLRVRTRDLEIRAARSRFRFALAAIVMIGMALGGFGLFFVERERSERNDRALSAVDQASFEASRLRAEAVATGNLSTWNAALREAQRAVDFAVEVEDPVRQRVLDLREELGRELTDQHALSELELLEQNRGEDSDELFESFLGVLSSLGIDVESTAPEEAGRVVRESAIRSALIVALDRWLLVPLGSMNDRLYRITQEADSDGWRRKVRAAIKEKDLIELSRLANDAQTRTLEPSTFELLASALHPRKRRWRGATQNPEHTKQAERLWRLAQRAHPDGFWINVHLGRFLRDQGRNDEAEPFVRVAVALRPRSAYARYELGSTLREKGQIVEAVEELRESIALDPDLSFAKAYGEISGILANEEERTALPRNELRAVVDRLSNVLDSVHRHYAASVVRVIAQGHRALGETREAILVIESGRRRGVSLGKRHRSGQTLEDLLTAYREEIAPKVVSYASIDAILGSSSTGAEEALRSLRQDENETGKSNPLLLYWRSRELELQGNTREAVSGYREAFELDRSLPEPAIRLTACLRSLGLLPEAEHVLREALHSESGQIPEIWRQWIEVSLGELGRTAQQSLDALPKSPPSAYGADLVWLFERIASGTPVFINCGGDEYSGSDGSHWGKDRFFSTTSFSFSGARFFGEISRTADDTLYQSDRVFFPTMGDPSRRIEGYRIPLPRGAYAVELHFAEIYPPAGERREFIRRFDVFVENEAVREDYEPARRGLGVAEAFNMEVMITDGVLDIDFAARSREPKISAIAVRPAR